MADNQRPYRTNEAPARGVASSASVSGSDPLAELARLIGQTDPFGEFGRENARRPAPPPPLAPPTAPSFSGADYFDAPAAPPPDPAPLPPPAFAPPPRMRQPYAAAAQPAYEAGPDHLSNPELGPEGEHYYEDAPPPKRRMGILAVAAVFALAVIGTAGAFGYRAMFGSRTSAPPPVIKADATPSKVVPAAAAKAPNKLIYDRVADHGEGEKLVSREEKPVEVKAPDIKTAPPLAAVPPPQANAAPAAAQPAPGSGVIATEPKKVHTIAIRPDQMGDSPQATAAPAAPPPAPAAAPAPVRPAPQPQVAVAPPPVANPAPPRRPEPRAAAPERRTAAAPANAPLSLNPNAPAVPRPMRTAAVAAPAAPAAQAPHSGGGYAVQVSSQRSEAEAQAAFRGLQAKYPNILGKRQASIHKVELGAKGTYYRTLVGPFASANEATELCNGLRAAGGQCIIQRN
ncbi:MAG TPA: SPOR domain-containing protein [Pseudolabrys sp.]|nr:SPOR domain-containing protein [Pseudolabrys sp.]